MRAVLPFTLPFLYYATTLIGGTLRNVLSKRAQ